MTLIASEHVDRLQRIAAVQPYPLLFATISGAHLYGFASPDSDFDLRGVHVLPLQEVVGLKQGQETIECEQVVDGFEIDLVTHDAHKFFRLLLRKNGYVLEQLLSPLVVKSGPMHEELKSLASGCITRHHSHHYLGFAETQWRLFEKERPRRIKPLLYVYRVLLTGIHLMNTGVVEANLVKLNEIFGLSFIPELVSRKLDGHEQQTLDDANVQEHHARYVQLIAQLEEASRASHLPEIPTAGAALHDLLVRIRIGATSERE